MGGVRKWPGTEAGDPTDPNRLSGSSAVNWPFGRRLPAQAPMPTDPLCPQTSLSSFRDRRVLVVGLGRFGGGVGVTRWLANQGASVTVTDTAEGSSLIESVGELSGIDVQFRLGGHEGIQPGDYDLVIINPAVRKDQSNLFREIVRRDVPWTTELNLFCERCRATVIGITGSYGKSTTCSMLAHVLQACGGNPGSHRPKSGSEAFGCRRVHLGGNIGRSLLSDLADISANDIVVLEISNAQLEDLPRIGWTPQLAAITNLFPHHLDRYSGFDGYIAAKMNIIAARGDQRVVVGELHPEAEARLIEILDGQEDRLMRVGPPRGDLRLSIPGKHNLLNAACVSQMASVLGLADGDVVQALAEFRGLPHRLEFVGQVSGAACINDSKSTAPAATIMALQAAGEMLISRSGGGLHQGVTERTLQQRSLITIVGGQDKGVSLRDCAQFLASTCRLVICMGQAGPKFADAMARVVTAPAGGQGALSCPEIHVVPDLPSAVRYAAVHAGSDDLVLFSPGAPSFDQYVNFAERGRHFASLVQEISQQNRSR